MFTYKQILIPSRVLRTYFHDNVCTYTLKYARTHTHTHTYINMYLLSHGQQKLFLDRGDGGYYYGH